MREGLGLEEKDPRKSLHAREVPTPEPGPGEAVVAVMASSVNYNTVWPSLFEPVSTLGFRERYGKVSNLAPMLEVWKAERVIVFKRSRSTDNAGVQDPDRPAQADTQDR